MPSLSSPARLPNSSNGKNWPIPGCVRLFLRLHYHPFFRYCTGAEVVHAQERHADMPLAVSPAHARRLFSKRIPFAFVMNQGGYGYFGWDHPWPADIDDYWFDLMSTLTSDSCGLRYR